METMLNRRLFRIEEVSQFCEQEGKKSIFMKRLKQRVPFGV